ncbi:hypothetical protein QKU48_gp1290 [Fadolivirus algeromassiliense]|jgi:hypothetical protein|uniref:Uncharacterized protein n=1 Tax=Fadolivirus FV1/VV64 TaxID=3070911 RepID=A0A7D3UQV8_9VIRU|nr:hypothetical protein QKU48_gp1290 [Fadolivirus algeromassiliense]QKF94748.1 hypothetical protein Fadolivirus_1_1290 [Fadolivirus FV1/VV64]
MDKILDDIYLIQNRNKIITELVNQLENQSYNKEFDDMVVDYKNNIVTVNTTLSLLYSYFTGDPWVPKCTTLWDYSRNGGMGPTNVFPMIIVNFPINTIKKNLSQDILDNLKKYDIHDNNLEIFLNIQSANTIGEFEDHLNGTPPTTRIRPHGWADPDMPLVFKGSRINRNFMVGIFDPEYLDIEDEVKIYRMTSFNLHLHDQLASPRNMGIRLPGTKIKLEPTPYEDTIKVTESRNESFWTLVIDHTQPIDKRRAVVTLHWLYSDNNSFYGLSDMKTWKELYEYIKKHSKLSTHSGFKKLNTLLHSIK